jgi:uncharacterized membrane protein YebE (DUF533 family)
LPATVLTNRSDVHLETASQSTIAQRFFEQFVVAGAKDHAARAAQPDRGFVAGGLLGLLLGRKKRCKKAGKAAGGAVACGGAAALGAPVYRAAQNWQANKRVGAVQSATDFTPLRISPAGSARPARKDSGK